MQQLLLSCFSLGFPFLLFLQVLLVIIVERVDICGGVGRQDEEQNKSTNREANDVDQLGFVESLFLSLGCSNEPRRNQISLCDVPEQVDSIPGKLHDYSKTKVIRTTRRNQDVNRPSVVTFLVLLRMRDGNTSCRGCCRFIRLNNLNSSKTILLGGKPF